MKMILVQVDQNFSNIILRSFVPFRIFFLFWFLDVKMNSKTMANVINCIRLIQL
jgi:hypothetical protein